MLQEIIYTSAPQGLKPGSRGFCTVMSSPGMPVNLAQQLEALSGYRHLFPPQDPQAALNPTVYAHLRLNVAGRPLHILSRIADAGLDYSQRTNKFAHHLVLDAPDCPPGGPAWALATPGLMATGWDGQPRVAAVLRKLPRDERPEGPCTAWEAQLGDAGWAGVLAETAAVGRSAVLLFEPGMEVLPLFVEALSLLPPAQRWTVTFSTFFTRLPPGVNCQWRAVLAGSAEARALAAGPHLVIDLRKPRTAPNGPLVEAARIGAIDAFIVGVDADAIAIKGDLLDDPHLTSAAPNVAALHQHPDTPGLRPPRLPPRPNGGRGPTQPRKVTGRNRRFVGVATAMATIGLLALVSFAAWKAPFRQLELSLFSANGSESDTRTKNSTAVPTPEVAQALEADSGPHDSTAETNASNTKGEGAKAELPEADKPEETKEARPLKEGSNGKALNESSTEEASEEERARDSGKGQDDNEEQGEQEHAKGTEGKPGSEAAAPPKVSAHFLPDPLPMELEWRTIIDHSALGEDRMPDSIDLVSLAEAGTSPSYTMEQNATTKTWRAVRNAHDRISRAEIAEARLLSNTVDWQWLKKSWAATDRLPVTNSLLVIGFGASRHAFLLRDDAPLDDLQIRLSGESVVELPFRAVDVTLSDIQLLLHPVGWNEAQQLKVLHAKSDKSGEYQLRVAGPGASGNPICFAVSVLPRSNNDGSKQAVLRMKYMGIDTSNWTWPDLSRLDASSMGQQVRMITSKNLMLHEKYLVDTLSAIQGNFPDHEKRRTALGAEQLQVMAVKRMLDGLKNAGCAFRLTQSWDGVSVIVAASKNFNQDDERCVTTN